MIRSIPIAYAPVLHEGRVIYEVFLQCKSCNELQVLATFSTEEKAVSYVQSLRIPPPSFWVQLEAWSKKCSG